MTKKSVTLYPGQTAQMSAFGDRIRLARLRRKLTTTLFSERMGVSRETLRRVENGDPTVAFGSYLSALQTLGLSADVNNLANDDVLGRKLQDAMLIKQPSRTVSKNTNKRTFKSPAIEGPLQEGRQSLASQVLAKYKTKYVLSDKD